MRSKIVKKVLKNIYWKNAEKRVKNFKKLHKNSTKKEEKQKGSTKKNLKIKKIAQNLNKKL